MGTKTTAKDMMKICDELLLIRGWKDVEDVKEVTKKLDSLTAMTYNEARAEEIIKKIIERSKQDLINLIKEDEAFTRNEEIANNILQQIKTVNEKAKLITSNEIFRSSDAVRILRDLWDILRRVQDLKALLQKDADIAEAVQIVARDLERLMQTLRKTER